MKSTVSKILIACTLFCLADFSTADAKFKFTPPNPSTEFEKMDYPQVYPTYSWEPVAKTEFYQVQVVRVEGLQEKIVSDLTNSEALNRVTDWQALTQEGNYFWRVRVVDKKKRPLSDWSKKKFFSVTTPVTFAALGDSITHGGANFIPAGQLACQWETFCDVPIKNIGRSGDTTQMMVERFENDVLPFKPKVLFIMGGVNDIRGGINSGAVIKNLETLREKCLAHEIIPVFGTLTPMNEKIMRGLGIFITDGDWRGERQKINAWVLENGGVDVTQGLCDSEGELRADFTPDGLHPDLRGKKLMGEAIGKFLREKFPALTDGR